MKKSRNRSRVFKMTAFILVILMCTVFIYCACSSFDNSRISQENGAEHSADVSITCTMRGGLDYIVNVKKSGVSSRVRISDKNSRFLYEAIMIEALLMSAVVCVLLSQVKNQRIKFGNRTICYIHSKDGKKEQITFLAV